MWSPDPQKAPVKGPGSASYRAASDIREDVGIEKMVNVMTDHQNGPPSLAVEQGNENKVLEISEEMGSHRNTWVAQSL